MIKFCLLFFVLLLATNTVFAARPGREIFFIRNNSNNDIVVNTEFWYSPGNNLDPQFIWAEGVWHQTISGIRLSVRDLSIVLRRSDNVIRPNQEMRIIDYSVAFMSFNDMVAIPIMDKLNAIFKRLEIIRDDGKVLKTLEDLEAIDLQKRIPWRGLVRYTLEIFDCYEGVRE